MAHFLHPTAGPERRSRLAQFGGSIGRRLGVGRPSDPPTDPTDLVALSQRFKQRGIELFEHRIDDSGAIVCGRCRVPSPAERMPREWRHRLEGATDPGEMATVSGLRCPSCWALGLLSLPYGPQADGVEADVLVLLQDPQTDSLEDALANYPPPALTERVTQGIRRACRFGPRTPLAR